MSRTANTKREAHRCCLACVILLLAFLTPVSMGFPGELDRTFGPGGRTVLSFSSGNDSVEDMVLQPDGKIVIAATIGFYPGISVSGGVTRLKADGTVDTNFGSSGRSVLTVAGFNTRVEGVALQPDGKVVVCGSAFDAAGNGTILLARYLVNGELDLSFGTAGKVLTQVGQNSNALDSAIQSNGKIVIVGIANRDFLIARYNADGSLDSSFGSNGIFQNTFGPVGALASDVELLSDGRILATGYISDNPQQIAIVRYLSTGQLDTSFDLDGKVTVSFAPGINVGFDSAIQPDGKIVVSGYHSADSTATFPALVRLNDNGSLDSSFGVGGKVTVQAGTLGGIFYSIGLDPANKIVAVGSARDLARPNNQDFFVSRFNNNGSLDPTFGSAFNGKVRLSISRFSENDEAKTVAIQPDGKIVVGGTAPRHYRRPFDFALVRLLGN